MHGYIVWEHKRETWGIFFMQLRLFTRNDNNNSSSSLILPKPCAHVWPHFLYSSFIMLSDPCWRLRLPFSSIGTPSCTSFPNVNNDPGCPCGHDAPFHHQLCLFLIAVHSSYLIVLGNERLHCYLYHHALMDGWHSRNDDNQWRWISLTSSKPQHRKREASHGSHHLTLSLLALSLALSSSSATSFAQQWPRASYAKWCSSPIHLAFPLLFSPTKGMIIHLLYTNQLPREHQDYVCASFCLGYNTSPHLRQEQSFLSLSFY